MPQIDPDDRAAIVQRIQELQRGEFQPLEFFDATYGITVDALQTLMPFVERWVARASKGDAKRGAMLSRYKLESFLKFFNHVPPLQAAYRVGMSQDSLSRVADYAVRELGVPQQAIGVAGAVFQESFVDRIHHFFPRLRNTTFSNHTSYCKALHEALRAEGIEIEPRYDPVALKLNEADPDLAHDADIVTGGPIGLRFCVWLNFEKPFALEPDKTSALTFVQYRDELEAAVPDYFSVDNPLLARLRPDQQAA